MLKKKITALVFTAILLIPGNIYGQSRVVSLEGLDNCTIPFFRFLADWGIRFDEEMFPESDYPESEESGTESEIALEMLEQVNQQRRSAGLSELSLSQELSEVSQVKAEDMRDSGYFSHTSPNYGSLFEMLKVFGIQYRTAGENIAKGQKTVESVMNAWMGSSGHRENILNESFTKLGVGYCTDASGNTYWVQMFVGE